MNILNTEPRISKRHCGGWLAVSEEGAILKIGVTGETEQQVRDSFGQAIKEWSVIFDCAASTRSIGETGAQ